MHILCELAGVSRSGYYKWLQGADEPDKDATDYLAIKAIFDHSKGTFGWRSIKMRLPSMNHKKIQRIMRTYGLRAKVRQRNPYRATHKQTMEHRIFPNKLQRNFNQTVPFTVFCTDITYLSFRQGFVYLSVVKDVATSEVIAWKASLHIDMALVLETIRGIPSERCANALIHSDQGFHYTSPAFSAAVEKLKMIQSMSGKGQCIDNAPIESFFGHMKDELDCRSCASFTELCSKIEDYMKYYNHERKQWTRKRMTPVEYRNHLLAQVEG